MNDEGKKELLFLIKELCDLNYVQGRHSCKWECCNDKGSVGDEYLENMFPFAKFYGVDFDYDLEKNFDKATWEEYLKFGEGYAMDCLGSDLKEIVEKKIVSEILDLCNVEE